MESADANTFVFNLIENVAKRTCLYDKSDPFYYNKNVREKSWVEVAQACNRNSTECKHRWKLLRERFCKELKKIDASSSSGMNYLQEWKFLQPMMFLKKFLVPRRFRDNVEDTDSHTVEESLSEDFLIYSPTTPDPLKKSIPTVESLCRKVGEAIVNIEKKLTATAVENTDEAFAKTLVLLMKDLPTSAKDDFQLGIMQELYRLRKTCRNERKMESADANTFIYNLVENVEKRKCLYEKSDAFYYNQIVKDKSWVEIAEACGKSATECKHRWKLLRERFCKELKRLEASSGSRMRNLQEWTFLQSMMFLKESIAPRGSRDNVEDSDSQSPEVIIDFPIATTLPRKRSKLNFDSICQKFDE